MKTEMNNFLTIIGADRLIRLDYTKEEWIVILKALGILLVAILAAVIE